MLSTCGLLLYFVKLLWTLIIKILVVVVVVITIFQNWLQGNHVTVFTVVELYFMYTVDSLLLTIARTCMCIHFLFAFIFSLFSYPDTVAEHGKIGRSCLICVSHLPVSHVTALEIWQFSLQLSTANLLSCTVDWGQRKIWTSSRINGSWWQS